MVINKADLPKNQSYVSLPIYSWRNRTENTTVYYRPRKYLLSFFL